MKRLFFNLLLALTVFVKANAQINVNINLGSQPSWGPSGYDAVDYYYLPDIETYYSVPKKQFIYLNNGQWVFTNSLPARYQGYNLYEGYKVVVNRPSPYLQFEQDRVKYAGYKGKKGAQVTIKQKKAANIHKTTYSNSGNGSKAGSKSKKFNNGNGASKAAAQEHGNSGRNGKGKEHSNGKGKH